MITINNHSIKSSISEMNITEYEYVSTLYNSKTLDHIDKFMQIFVYLGLPEAVLDEVEPEDFLDAIDKFQIFDEEFNDRQPLQEIDVNGRTYRSYEEKFRVKIKDLALIESAVKTDENNYLARAIAIIYKDVSLTDTEHYTKEHIDYKAIIMSSLPAVTVIPVLKYLGEAFSKKLKSAVK